MCITLKIPHVFESRGTASGVQRKHDELLRMALLHFLWRTLREVEEATLLVNISTKMVYHMVYPHQSKRTTTLQFQCVNT